MEDNYQGVTYSEVRVWIVWLQIFTIKDLADAMFIDYAVAERFTIAAMWHGIIDATDDTIWLDGKEEILWSYVPIPVTITRRTKRTPPEKLVGYTNIVEPRGLTQMLISERLRRQAMAMPGIRHQVRLKEKRREAQTRARLERAEKQRLKARRDRDLGRVFITKKRKKRFDYDE